MFVDIHSHILPGIDDGAADTDAALDMLELSLAEGGDNITLVTPHYICGSLKNDRSIVVDKLAELKSAAAERGLKVNLHCGNEIFLSTEVPELLNNDEICTLAGSSYVLVELPMMSVPDYADEVLYRLKLHGYKPIIAHPERNHQIMSDPNILYDFVCKGIYSQVNASSLKGVYGKKVMEIALNLIRHNLVHFVASDAHSCRGRSPKLQRAYNMVNTCFGKKTADRLFTENGLAVLGNRAIEAEEPVQIKKGFGLSILSTFTRLKAMNFTNL